MGIHRIVAPMGVGVLGRGAAMGGAGLGIAKGAGLCMGLGPIAHIVLGPIGLLTAAGVAGYYLLRTPPEETNDEE